MHIKGKKFKENAFILKAGIQNNEIISLTSYVTFAWTFEMKQKKIKLYLDEIKTNVC